ncbi:hypothetical protein OG562_15285 [Streptomyces sp. NBC_01275]|uniref:hypothetical protein n=1 Tax=Streptomyces sp. NBC_01275 TaxID=2903807 RepID=UPI00224E2441|nr:hypothetical protein [Streptomyces sp. NBC_01275]MCX4762315.1 hypothetical protein [Streptomyces sp. NBC_01275]
MGTGLRRRLVLAVAVLTASALLGLAAPASAEAASSHCAGRKVRTLSFSTGSVQVYKRNGYVCAVTLPANPGGKKKMSVSVQARGNRPVKDEGRYSLRAGPVTVHAGHRCVWVKGAVGRGSISSGWILC